MWIYIAVGVALVVVINLLLVITLMLRSPNDAELE